MQHPAWHWPLFAWGIGATVVGVGIRVAIFRLVILRLPHIPGKLLATRADDERIYVRFWVVGGLILSAFVSIIDIWELDAVWSVLMAYLVVDVLVAVVKLRRPDPR